jgi:uncharacterized caspase-like protein
MKQFDGRQDPEQFQQWVVQAMKCKPSLGVKLVTPVINRPPSQKGVKKMALLIGVAKYKAKGLAPLHNPVNDVKALQRVLENKMGFSVTTSMDQTGSSIRKTLNAFCKLLDKNTIALIHFSGHGSQDANINYIYGADKDVNQGQVSVEDIQRLIVKASPSLFVLLLDCCRSVGSDQDESKGPRCEINLDETHLKYLAINAVARGGDSDDGPGKTSPFTAALCKHLPTNGHVIEAAEAVQCGYEKMTGQRTIMTKSIIMNDDFYLM